MRLLYKTGPMESLRKWLYRPKRDDPSPLAQFFFADEALNIVAAELDSFDGRKDPERCSSLVNQLQHAQDRVLNITNQIMDQVLGDERVARGFRVKFPEEVLQENLGVQLWFGAECLAAGSSIMNREEESVAMRPLAKALTRSLETVRSLLREQCLRTKGLELPMQDDMLRESLRICDRLFAEFELCYVSAMVNVKTPHEFEAQQLICVLFSETLRSALQSGLLTQEQVDSYDPALMFAVPRLSIVSGLLLYSRPPLAIDGPPEEMSDMFRPFRSLLRKIRALLYTLDRRELRELRRLLATDGDVTCSTHNESTSEDQYPDIGEYVSKFYAKNSQCRSLYHSQNSTTSETTESEVQPDTEESEAISPEPPKLSLPEDRSRRTSRNESTDLSSLRNLSTNGLMTFDPAVINEASMSENRQMPDNDLVTSLNEQVTKIADRLSSIVNDSEIIDHTSGHSFSTNDVPTVVTDEVSFTQSDQLNLPSTSHGYLIPNAISQEPVVMASLSHNNSAIFNQEENNDEDCPFIVADNGLDSTIVSNNISIANEMLSSILHDNNENTDNNTDEVTDKVKFALGYESDPDSPGDSGVSTENTSLDRSPDTENNKEHFMKQNRVLKNDTDNKTESVLENSFSEFRENGDVTVNINYVEHNALQKNEAGSSRDVDTSNDIEERNKTLQDWGANTSEQQEHRSIREVITELNQEDTSRNLAQDVEETSRRDVEDDRRQKKRKSGKTKKKRSKMWSPGMVLLDSRAMQANNPLRLNLDNFIDDSNTSYTVAECADDEQIALALQAQELAHRQKARGKFQSSEDLVHRLFVCIAGVADQLQTNFAADLRHILKSVFAMNQTPDEKEIEKEEEVYEAPRIQNGGSFDSVYSAEEAYADSHSSASSHSDNAANANENRNEVEINNRQPSHNTTRRNSMNQPTSSSSERRKSVNIQSSVSTGDLSENRVEGRVERAPEWVPDIAAPDCMRCAAHFTAFRRRHHCRNCGKVFCASCSSNSIPLPRYGQMKPVRVCEECFRGIAQSCTRSAR